MVITIGLNWFELGRLKGEIVEELPHLGYGADSTWKRQLHQDDRGKS